MAVYYCWLNCEDEDEARIIFDCKTSQEAAEKFADTVWYIKNMWDVRSPWENDYAVNVRKQISPKKLTKAKEIKTYKIQVEMSPNFRAELVK